MTGTEPILPNIFYKDTELGFLVVKHLQRVYKNIKCVTYGTFFDENG